MLILHSLIIIIIVIDIIIIIITPIIITIMVIIIMVIMILPCNVEPVLHAVDCLHKVKDNDDNLISIIMMTMTM